MTPFEVVAGGSPTPEETAAIAAALAVVLAPDPAPARTADRWRWSGRTWQSPMADWRDPGSTAHPSFP